jgi:acetyl-CoA carboxylase biotin carboxyl carrier protein
MELTRLKALIDMVSQSTVGELEIAEGGERVLIRKQQTMAERTSPPAAAAARKAPAPRLVPDRSSAEHRTDPRPNTHAVISPMFGIFHGAPSPDASPYVQVGGQVRAGDTLCLIEAMKSFNAVAADRDGTVTAIPVENGQEVEPGQVLIQIGPCQIGS